MKKTILKKEIRSESMLEDYSLDVEFKFTLPHQILLLCRLMKIEPETLLIDFMDNLACASWHRVGRDKAKEHLINYFVEHGYGKQTYSEESIRTIFKELDAVGMLFPSTEDYYMLELYEKWRDEHYKFWFEKWRRLSGNVG